MAFFEDLISKTVKRGSPDTERLSVSFFSSGAAILHVDLKGSEPQVTRFSLLEVSPILSDNEKRIAFQAFLHSLDMKKLPRLTMTWSDGMTFRQLEMPDMPAEDLEKAFEWELKKKFFCNPEENHLGFSDVMSVEGAEGPEKLFNVFYCEKKAAGPRFSFAEELGLDIQSLAPAQVSIAAFAHAAAPNKDADTIVCERDGAVLRILAIRGDHNMLVRQLTLGIQDSDVTEATLGRIAEEIKKTIDFYESQKHSRPITKVLMVGSMDGTRQVYEFMSRTLPVSVAVPDMAPFLSPVMPAKDRTAVMDHAGLLAAALGALMISDDTMNLAPEDIKSREKGKKTSRSFNLALVGIAFLLALVTGGMMFQTHLMKGQLAVLQHEHEVIIEQKKQFEGTLARERIRRALLKGVLVVPSFLKDLGYRTPGLVTLNEVRYSRGQQTLLLRGDVSSEQRESLKSVTQFSTNLSESIFMQSLAVTGTSQGEDGKLHFDIDGVVKGYI